MLKIFNKISNGVNHQNKTKARFPLSRKACLKVLKASSFMLIAAALIVGGFFAPNEALAAVSITTAGGGSSISIDRTSSSGGSDTFSNLNGPTIAENNPGEINEGVHTLTLPDGWVFDTTPGTVFVFPGGGTISLSSNLAVVTSQTVSFEVATASTEKSSVVFNGLKVKPTGTVSGIPGDITYSDSGAGITGVDETTNFGTLSTVAGVVTKVAFTTQPGTTTIYGSTLSTQPVVKTQDQFGNNSANGASGKTVILTLSGAGTLLGTTLLDISSGTASFTDLEINAVGAKQLIAETTDLASITSDPFDITQKTLTATVTANDKTYNGNNTAVVTGADVSSDLVYEDAVTADITDVSAIFADANAGTEKTVTATGIVLVGEKSSNYSFDGTGTGTADINQLEITVTPVASQTKVYGEDDSIFTYTPSPVLLGSDEFTGALSRVANENVGAYAYTLGDLSAGSNYHLNLAEEIFTITQRPLTVTATGVEKEYDRTTNATVTLSSDKISGDDVTPAYTSASFSDKTVADGKTVRDGYKTLFLV